MVNDLFHSYPDHLLVDIAAVHSVQVHVPFVQVQGSERRIRNLQQQVKYGMDLHLHFGFMSWTLLYSLAKTPPPPPQHLDSYFLFIYFMKIIQTFLFQTDYLWKNK